MLMNMPNCRAKFFFSVSSKKRMNLKRVPFGHQRLLKSYCFAAWSVDGFAQGKSVGIRVRRISAVPGRNTSMLLSTRIVISGQSTALSAAGVSDEPPSVLFHNHSSITQILDVTHGPKKASGGTE